MNTAMITEADLLAVIDAFSAAYGWKDATASTHLFNDGKKVAQLRAGGTITVSRLNDALQYLSSNWPRGARWPKGVKRPAKLEASK
jgi:hypothetical protein